MPTEGKKRKRNASGFLSEIAYWEKFFKAWLITLGLALLMVFIIYTLEMRQLPSRVQVNGPDVEATSASQWETFRSEKYGFEVGYPAGWSASHSEGATAFKGGGSQQFSVAMIGSGSEGEALSSAGFNMKEGKLYFEDGINPESVAAIKKVIDGNKIYYAPSLARIYSVNGYQGTGDGFTALIGRGDDFAVINAAAMTDEQFSRVLSTFKFRD